MQLRQRRYVLAACLGGLIGAAVQGFGTANAQGLNGKDLAFDRSKGNCLTCHEITGGDAPGNLGPPLTQMKSRFSDRKELIAIISDETKRNPLTVMPPFKRNLILTDQEIEAVADFLLTQ